MAKGTKRLVELARVIRSKNAGPFRITMDVMFEDQSTFEAVKRSGVITPALISRLYSIPPEDVLVCTTYEPSRAIKVSIRRPIGSGDPTESDVYGCQQHIPLMNIEVPIADA